MISSSSESFMSTTGSAVTMKMSGSKRNNKVHPAVPEIDLDDAEGSLLNLLSYISELEGLYSKDGKESSSAIVTWLWSQLQPSKRRAAPSTPTAADPTTISSYTSALQSIRNLLQAEEALSPLELHATVKQAMVFSCGPENSTFTHICLLLCVVALRNRPSTMARWKRWQSLIFETISMYQKYVLDETTNDDGEDKDVSSSADVHLWLDHVLPACRHVQKALPAGSDVLWTPLLAGMVGTTTKVVKSSHSNSTLSFLKAIGPVVTYRYEKWVWSHPWRQASGIRQKSEHVAMASSDEDDEGSSSQLTFLKHKSDLTWWTTSVDHHEAVCGMDTAWDEVGVAMMSVTGFLFRPLVLSPTYIWDLWFPHVSKLILYGEEHHSSNDYMKAATELLESVLSNVPDESKMFDIKQDKNLPNSPIGIMQLLMNQYMAVAPKSTSDAATILNHVKKILTKYEHASQVVLVKALIEDCPQVGLIPKLLDLLRPLVAADPPLPALWEYLSLYWNEMVDNHIDPDKKSLCDVEELLNRVEPYVSILTMLQLYLMIRQKIPLDEGSDDDNEVGSTLRSFHIVLQDRLQHWSSSPDSMAPDNYYRLFLLEGALQQVVSLINDIEKARMKEEEDELRVVMGPPPPPPVSMGPLPPPVVMGPELPP